MLARVFNGAVCALVLLLASTPAAAAWTPFTIADIEIRGAERLGEGTVLNYLPARTGERFGADDAQRAVRALYDSGLFRDVSLARSDDTLIVRIEERPAIGEINLEGDFSIKEDKLRELLNDVGLSTGEIFDGSVLDRVRRSLQQQMFSRGKYAMELDVGVRDLPRNRVAIDITLREGKTAHIEQIELIGNEAFDDATLKNVMESASSQEASWFSSADEYSRTTLEGDLESIRSYYLDRGYVNFSVVSSPVTITPDKKGIYVTIRVEEGEQYRVDEITIAGDLPVDASELREQIRIEQGELFSRKAIQEARSGMSDTLAREGYAFARINATPEVDESDQTVDIQFSVDPGKRAYVRRITFTGQRSTQGRVFRREMRQMEGGVFSPGQVERSRVRIQRLASVRRVRVNRQRVEGQSDQVDINYEITERRTGSLSLGAGFSSSEGVTFNASIQEKNLFGTGRDLSVRLDTSEASRQAQVRFKNPYYTDTGVSRTLRATYRETSPNDVTDTADFFSDNLSVGVEYGIPQSEFNTLDLGLAIEGTRLRTTSSTPASFEEFIELNGDEFLFLEGTVAWTRDTRNRTIFPEAGARNRFSLDVALPGSDLQVYKGNYQFNWFTPLTEYVVGSTQLRVAAGDSYGSRDERPFADGLPFFRHFFAGGIRSVRGYQGGSLGPEEDGDAIGGDLLTTGSLELIVPPPFALDTGQSRLSLFYDFGNVYPDAESFEANELRTSVGIAFNWRSPVGPLSFSFAEPINPEPQDDTETFQFTIGTLF
jgi:outer membrane protein insertion porin family